MNPQNLPGLDDERLYRCPDCLDTGFVATVPESLPSVVHPGRRLPNVQRQTVLRPCTKCDGGIAIEAGEWAKVLFEDKRHKPTPADIAQFKRRQRTHPRGVELRERVDRLIGEKAARAMNGQEQGE